ncbi:TonB-dependent receptor [Allopusillimonas ginsengisoli]|nr:TonB-dependent receptor [Allopusillimonas ginsengisoli]
MASLVLPLHAYAQASNVATLPDVVVTASGFEQALSDAPASITVITQEQLEGKFYRDVTDALQDVPGVSIEGGAGGKIESTSVTIRGLGEQYVLFLVDGKPLGASSEAYYNGFGGGAQVGWLPPVSAIERIEVIRGPMSSLYGSSALGGVINVITKKVTQEWVGSVTMDTVLQKNSDAGNTYQGRYYLSGPLVQDRLGVTVYGSKYYRGEDDFDGGYAGKKSLDNTAKLDWILNEAHSLEFEGGVATHDNERTVKTGAPGDMNNRRVHYGITHDWRWGRNFSTKTYAIREDVSIENGGNESSYSASILNTKTVMPLDAHMITLGAEYKKEETDHDESRFPGSRALNLTRWQAALFAEDEYFITDAFSLTGGVRLDRNEHYGTKVTPRLYGVYRVNPDFLFKGGVSGGYKTPTLKQADENIVEQAGRGRSWDMGNNDLQPERSTNYELGFSWNTAEQVNFGVMAYYTRYKDKIDKQTICTSPPGAPNCHYNGETRESINQYVNLDAATLRGVEVTFGMPLGPTTLNANYTYSDSEITSGINEGQPLNNLPRHMFNLGLDWKATADFGVWGKLRYKSRSIEGGEERIPSYTLVDMGATYKFNRRVSGFAGIYNVFDKVVTSEEFGKTLDGRRLYAGVTVEF